MSLVSPLPVEWLIHNIEYHEKEKGRSATGNNTYKNPIVIERVRYDESTTFNRTVSENTLLYNGVIFIDSRNSINVPSNFVENSKVVFNGKELSIKRVVTCYHPSTNLVRHYELEVI